VLSGRGRSAHLEAESGAAKLRPRRPLLHADHERETLQMRGHVPSQLISPCRNVKADLAPTEAAHMSGLEVTGIVLGALPLIISALENLRDGASRIGRLINFNVEYSKTWGEVEDEELMYRMQLKRLLKPLVRDDILTDDGPKRRLMERARSRQRIEGEAG
jgi:hypothetical protein